MASIAFAHTARIADVPAEVASNHFTVALDGESTPVFHAAVNLYFLNFEAGKHTRISVTGPSEDFWAKGVEVQPWRYGIRPARHGRTISFTLDGPAKISISRPGDFLGDAEMLYLFANKHEDQPSVMEQHGLRYYGPGIHKQNIDAATGDSIYLAPGAVVFGSLNLWNVDHVKVFGRGVIVYDGPQNAASDDGWMQKRNWHCIGMLNAHDISVEGITCVVRSRTWQVQMKDSHRIVFDNIKVIGANTANANADGMDWLGGGDTVVRDSFFRAADDVFAMYTSWDGYGPKAFAAQGSPVTNIRIEDSVLSTSISNIVRVGWPEKNIEGGNFEMENTDVIHMGIGGCGIPFALLELWAEPAGRGKTAGIHFKDVRLEDWYSLLQLKLQGAALRDVSFTHVAALEGPSLVPSALSGDLDSLRFNNVTTGSGLAEKEADIPLDRPDTVPATSFSASGPRVRISYDTGRIGAHDPVHFKAVMTQGPASSLRYTWTFGDGTVSHKASVTHRFPDSMGTLLDGSGRFRVLLHVSDQANRSTWAYQPVVVGQALMPSVGDAGHLAGLSNTYSEQNKDGEGTSQKSGTAISLALPEGHAAEDYTYSFDGLITAPHDGTYTLLLVTNDGGEIILDGRKLGEAPTPFANVCGLAGNAARAVEANVALAKGPHHLHILETHKGGHDDFKVLWRVPGGDLTPIPSDVLSHD